jgi:hypothetical protein
VFQRAAPVAPAEATGRPAGWRGPGPVARRQLARAFTLE